LFKKLEARYEPVVEAFVEGLKKKNKEANYNPRVIVDDDGEGDDDYE